MANTLDLLRTRLRASGKTGISDALAYQVLSACQEMFNGVKKRVLTTKEITLDANTMLFDIRTKLTSPTGINIVSIWADEALDRTLIKLDDWREIPKYDQNWYNTTGSRHEVWAQMGADMFVVYPMVTTNVTVDVTYAGETTTLDDLSDDFDVPGEDQDTVYTLAEIILHMHMHNYPEAKARIKDLGEMHGIKLPGSEIG